MEKSVARSEEGATKRDYYSVLARSIATVSQDHDQLRALLYELARIKLRRDLYQRLKVLGWSGWLEQMAQLNAAIDQIEGDFVEGTIPLECLADLEADCATPGDYLSVADSRSETDYSSETDRGEEQSTALVPHHEPKKALIINDYQAPIQASLDSPFPYELKPKASLPSVAWNDSQSTDRKPVRGAFWSTAQLIVAAALGAAIFTAIDSQISKKSIATTPNATIQDSSIGSNLLAGAYTPGRPKSADFPLPTDYGVYAVSNGRLTELDVLSLKVPDPRVAISATISTPSRAQLPEGQLQFIVYRRDLINNAPDHVGLRVVARVARALTFDGKGKATTINVDNTWVVRGNSYQMRVAPMPDNPEMLVIRPESPDVVLPAGRYALVLKGAAYDVTLGGSVKDAAHCLERTEALGAPIYTECRDP